MSQKYYKKRGLILLLLVIILLGINFNFAGATYEIKYDGVYYYEHKINEADPETFQQLDFFWAKDNNKVFNKRFIVDGVDPATFKVINYEYGKDKSHVYWSSQFFNDIYVVKDADPNSFEQIYRSNNTIVKDKDRVYYVSMDTIKNPEIQGADRDNISIINYYYSKDQNNVFYKNKIVEGADPVTFIRIKGSVIDYGVDDQYVYCAGKKLKNSDSSTFEILDPYNAKDKNNVYKNYVSGCTIQESNVDTYKVISKNYSKDNNNVYFLRKVINGADPESFKIIKDIYGADKNHVYLMYDIIGGADPVTFHYLDHGYGRDDKNVFYLRNLIKGADVYSFKTIKADYASDDFASYFKDTVLSRFERERNIKNQKMYENLQGKILLQIEENGEAWYLCPGTNKAHYLGRPVDAFNIMRELGLGISEANYNSFNGYAPKSLIGKILLRVEAKGEAYYVNPLDSKMHYLGRPADAFQVMRNLGLGISNEDFNNLQ